MLNVLKNNKGIVMLSVLGGLCLALVVCVIVDATVIPSAHGTILEKMHAIKQ